MSVTVGTLDALRARPRETLAGIGRRNGWTLGLLAFLATLLVFTKIIQPSYGPLGIQNLAAAVLPLAPAAVAHAIIVLARRIDLSLASMMAPTSLLSAQLTSPVRWKHCLLTLADMGVTSFANLPPAQRWKR